MKSSIVDLIKICLYSFGFICVSSKISLAQVTSDNTVNTQVDQNGNVVEITGGETRDSNLFHSFQEFSIPTGNEAFFNNGSAIANIFSRVTGNTVSQIEGLIRANGSANLFLINPAGIIFGENASLDIGGSFLATTANSIQFNDGEFSAIAPEEKPILTISVPIGLSFDENPGEIINNSVANERRGLEVARGNNITLLGGNINFESGAVTASGGIVNLGGLAVPGLIAINEDASLTFPEDVAKADITLSNGAKADVSSMGEGNIIVNAGNLDLIEGSELRAGITADSTFNAAQAGDIAINVTDNLTLDQGRVINGVDANGIGNSGNIKIITGSLKGANGGRISASTQGQGNAGLVDIIAGGDVTFDGANSEGDRSGATSRVNSSGEGNAGGITISTTNLTLTNGGQINSSTQGQGNAGLVDIIAGGDVTFDGTTSEGDRSGVTSRVDSDGEGNAGGVIISTTNLTLTNGGRVDSSTSGQGDAGLVEIVAKGDVTFDGTTSEGDRSGVTSRVNQDGKGNVGDITISTTNLNLINGGRVDTASTRGTGDGGSIEITATKDITLRNNSPISAQASEKFNGGNINIDARFIIAFPGSTNQEQEKNLAIDSLSLFGNDIIASAEQGQGGNININTKSLFGIEERPLSNSTNDINASSEFSLDGVVVINTPDIDLQRELEQPELEIFTAEEAIANSCLANNSQPVSLSVGVNGELPKSSSSNYSDANFSLTGVGSLPVIPEKVVPTQRDQNQALIPAEKMVETEDGRIFLVTSLKKAKSLFCSPTKDKE